MFLHTTHEPGTISNWSKLRHKTLHAHVSQDTLRIKSSFVHFADVLGTIKGHFHFSTMKIIATSIVAATVALTTTAVEGASLRKNSRIPRLEKDDQLEKHDHIPPPNPQELKPVGHIPPPNPQEMKPVGHIPPPNPQEMKLEPLAPTETIKGHIPPTEAQGMKEEKEPVPPVENAHHSFNWGDNLIPPTP